MSLDQVRKRPGMYIGDTTDGSGLHNMIYEVVSNSISEAMAGFCDRVDVILNADGSVTVSDNGRGIPAEPHPRYGISAAEMILTELHAGGMFDRPKPHKVLHGVGLAVVNALSEWLFLRIWRNGVEHSMRFRLGAPEGALEVTGKDEFLGAKPKRGTEITFAPSAAIFKEAWFDFATLGVHMRELASLNSGAIIVLVDKRGSEAKQATFRA